MPTKKPDKQHHPRAQSFKRLAKRLRALKRDYPFKYTKNIFADLAKAFDEEAKLLRSMR